MVFSAPIHTQIFQGLAAKGCPSRKARLETEASIFPKPWEWGTFRDCIATTEPIAAAAATEPQAEREDYFTELPP
jgi:hypothetical protein